MLTPNRYQAPNKATKHKERAAIANDVQAFLDSGGKIDRVPIRVVDSKCCARCGGAIPPKRKKSANYNSRFCSRPCTIAFAARNGFL